MKRALEIFLNDLPVGTLHYAAEGNRESASFEYHPKWINDKASFQIDPELPLVSGHQFPAKGVDQTSVFFGCFADSEPDGWGRTVIARDHAKRRNEAIKRGDEKIPPALNSLDYLMLIDDVSRVGALRLSNEQGAFVRETEPGRRSTPPLIELSALVAASRAVESNTELAADLRYLLGNGSSLGGVRPKASVVDDDGVLSIGKFPSVQDTRAVTKGEVLALKLAPRAGIRSAEGQIVMADKTPVALIRRFDRTPKTRLMYASARTMLGVKDADDHTYTEIVDAIRKTGHSVASDLKELWRRIVFNVLITNVDDHLNNHGFLHLANGQWILAPAFDLNPFPDKQRTLKTWISEDTGPEATIDAAMSAAQYFGLKKDEATKIVGEVEAAVAVWRNVAQEAEMTPAEADQFAAAFEHAERKAAQKLT